MKPRTDNDFWGRLDCAIREKGWTREQLARKLPASPGSVSEWFSKRVYPSGKHMVRLAEVLEISADWLFLGKGEPSPPSPTLAEEQIRAIRRILERGPSAEREAELRRRAAEMKEAKKRARMDEKANPEQPPYNEERMRPRKRRGGG